MSALDGALHGLAYGRLALGSASRLAPRATANVLGVKNGASGELDYMTRIFGIRAIALGSGYLSSSGAARRRWQRIALGVDLSDTIAGIGHLRRSDIPRGSAVMLTAITGTYALIGALGLARDMLDEDGEAA